VNADGSVTYTPEADFVGTDVFEYAICDTGMPVLCDTALVTIVVNPVPDTTFTTTPEDTPVTVCTDTETNIQGTITSVAICGDPSNGTLELGVLPCVTYTPAQDYVGQDTACVITCTDLGLCDTTIIVFTVTPVNDPPVAVDDTDATDEDTPVVIDVQANDYDIDGIIDTASTVVTVDPTNGTATVNAD
ncbi:MAG: hypothetical protein GY743_22825, partial [Planctomycetaceae bacterium]|nr:hypothetical protein [Planctomycetaceae bacterium]